MTQDYDIQNQIKEPVILPRVLSVAILFSDFGPYHISRIEALSSALISQKSKLVAYRFSEKSDTYSWKSQLPSNIKVITLGTSPVNGFLDALRVAWKFKKSLIDEKIDVVFLPSYSPAPNFLCFLAAKSIGRKTILMNESWHGTEKAGAFGRWLKKNVVKNYDAALVGGSLQKEYACAYGLNPNKVFYGYDVVNVQYYKSEALKWSSGDFDNLNFKLPNRFFLNLGRFVKKKNLKTLVQAYSHMTKNYPHTNISLVLVGEGEEESSLKQLTKELGLELYDSTDYNPRIAEGPHVVFYPFQQVNMTPLFFSKCEAFILPSIYEEWGLVINEAMACGSAVAVSKNVGCSKDLVISGENGFIFNPYSNEELSDVLGRFALNSELSIGMGKRGQDIISDWDVDRFANGALNAINAATHNKEYINQAENV